MDNRYVQSYIDNEIPQKETDRIIECATKEAIDNKKIKG